MSDLRSMVKIEDHLLDESTSAPTVNWASGKGDVPYNCSAPSPTSGGFGWAIVANLCCAGPPTAVFTQNHKLWPQRDAPLFLVESATLFWSTGTIESNLYIRFFRSSLSRAHRWMDESFYLDQWSASCRLKGNTEYFYAMPFLVGKQLLMSISTTRYVLKGQGFRLFNSVSFHENKSKLVFDYVPTACKSFLLFKAVQGKMWCINFNVFFISNKLSSIKLKQSIEQMYKS